MLSKQFISFITVALSVLSVSEQALGRYRWLERDNKPVLLHPRRFGQQNPEVLTRLGSACAGQVCGVLAGQAVSTLLGAAAECAQQDMADQIIDAAQQFDETTKSNVISLAVEFRQVEKNTPPDFTTNPPTNRNSVFCQKAPKNAELDGLVQAQDPANDPNVFFDPALGKSVTKGSQANTSPFGSSGSTSNSTSSDDGSSAGDSVFVAQSRTISAAVTDGDADNEECDTSPVTVTVSANENAATNASGTDVSSSCSLVTLSVGAEATASAGSDSGSTGDETSSGAAATSTAASSDIGDFGSCSVPQIEFGTGFDGRKETSFQPVDKASYNHGSAQNIDIITQFICDTLTNSCGADQTAKDTCQSASSAASAAAAKTGAQADAFNAAFGISTNFAAVAAVDDQGNVVAGTGSGDASSGNGAADSSTSAADAAATDATASATDSAADSTDTAAASDSDTDSNVGDFGSCSVPQIEFGTGFDGRKETSFQPVDKASYNHGSAQNIDIITDFICDTLTNSCGADQTAKDTCATAQSAADAATAKTGAQADAFNAAFGITTNFASVQAVNDQGQVVAGTGSGSASGSASSDGDVAVASPTTSSADTAASETGADNSESGSTASGGNLQTFTGNLGADAPTVTALGNGEFQVENNSSFNSLQNALVRSCDVQNNQCANAANSSGNQGDLTVANCNQQQQQCIAQAQSAGNA